MRIPDVIDHKFEYPNGFLFQVSDRTASFVAPNGNSMNLASGVYTKNNDSVNFIPMTKYENVGIKMVDDIVDSFRTECNYVPEWIINATNKGTVNA